MYWVYSAKFASCRLPSWYSLESLARHSSICVGDDTLDSLAARGVWLVGCRDSSCGEAPNNGLPRALEIQYCDRDSRPPATREFSRQTNLRFWVRYCQGVTAIFGEFSSSRVGLPTRALHQIILNPQKKRRSPRNHPRRSRRKNKRQMAVDGKVWMLRWCPLAGSCISSHGELDVIKFILMIFKGSSYGRSSGHLARILIDQAFGQFFS
jgi:hypothetical protein